MVATNRIWLTLLPHFPLVDVPENDESIGATVPE